MQDNAQNPENTTSADPDWKNFNQKIFKNSFQKD